MSPSLPPVVVQEGACLIYVICVCLVRLYLQLLYRREHVLFTLFVLVWFVVTSSCCTGGSMSYLHYLCLFGSSLPPVVVQESVCLIYVICVCLVRLYLQLLYRGEHVLFTLFVFAWFVFTSSCCTGGSMSYLRYLCLFGSSLPPVVVQEGACLIYIICVCLVRLYLQLLYRRAYVLFTLFVFVWFVFTSSCCTGGSMSYLRYLCLFGSSLPPVVVQEGACLIYVICACLVRRYLQLLYRREHVLFTLFVFVWFVFTSSCCTGERMSYLRYLCLFGSSLPPVVVQGGACLIYVICVCLVRLYLQLLYRREHVLFTLFVFVWFVFTSSCCTGGSMSYLHYLCLFGSSLPPVVVQEGACLIYVICVCLVRLYLQLLYRREHVLFTLFVFVWFVFTSSCCTGGSMSYLRYLCLFGSSLPPVVVQEGACLIYVICVCLVRLDLQLLYRREHVLFTLFVFVWFVFTSSCCTGGRMSYLRYLCLFGSSKPPVVVQEGACLIYIICVCLVRLYLQLLYRREHVLFTLFVFVWFVFTSSCCTGGSMSYLHYLCLFGSSLPPVVVQEGVCLIYVICVCLVRLNPQLLYRRPHVLFTLFVFVWFVFTSSCCTGGLMSYLRYLCLFGSSLPPVVVQEGVCLIYVICVCLVRLYPQLLYRRAYVLFTLFVFVWFV